jgi:2-amino-4-hydroxy-6-hydroxymethyldihydropteridine diphosphokinase
VPRTKSVTAYVALGANLGDRRRSIGNAIQRLDETVGIVVKKQSSLMESPAVGGPSDSPPFLNSVIEIETTVAPQELLRLFLKIEQSLGRRRREKWEPRPIDLDLILYGDQIIDTPDLNVPHPLMHTRPFVLQPLAEIAPDSFHPVLRQTASQLLAKLA